jgi:hypothetical protein
MEYRFSNGNMPPIFDLPTQSFSPSPTAFSTLSARKLAEPAPPAVDNNPKQEKQPDMAAREERRDKGVLDETWAQL